MNASEKKTVRKKEERRRVMGRQRRDKGKERNGKVNGKKGPRFVLTKRIKL